MDSARHVVEAPVIQRRFGHLLKQPVGIVKQRIEGQTAAQIRIERRGDIDFHKKSISCGGGQLEGFFALDLVAIGENL